jgi:hypothetical protein
MVIMAKQLLLLIVVAVEQTLLMTHTTLPDTPLRN